jgi:hypothetical protein
MGAEHAVSNQIDQPGILYQPDRECRAEANLRRQITFRFARDSGVMAAYREARDFSETPNIRPEYVQLAKRGISDGITFAGLVRRRQEEGRMSDPLHEV